MTKHEEGVWYRDGDLLFTVQQVGWDKGEPKMSNRSMVNITRGKDVPDAEHENLIREIYEFLLDN